MRDKKKYKSHKKQAVLRCISNKKKYSPILKKRVVVCISAAS